MKRPRLDLLLCFVIAFFLWVLYTLTNEYSSLFRYTLTIETNMEGHANKALADNTLLVKAKARGFAVVRNALRKSPPPLTVFVDQAQLKSNPQVQDGFFVVAGSVSDLVNEALGMSLELESLYSDTLSFVLPEELYRTIPVKLVADVDYLPQYMSFEPIKVTPDSVQVYGSKEQLASITEIPTRKLSYLALHHSVQGFVKLDAPEEVRLSDKEVEYNIQVKRYVEMSMDVPISCANAPTGTEVFFLPDAMTLVFRCPFEAASRITANQFTAQVDYEVFINSVSGKVVPQLVVHPTVISHVVHSPEYVDALVQMKRTRYE